MNFLTDGFYSLGSKINKMSGRESNEETQQGVVSDNLHELELKMKDEDLVKLIDDGEKKWKESDVYSDWKEAGEENEKYWQGKHYDHPKRAKSRPQIDNVLFESLETFFPQVTRRNPEPMVTLSRKVKPSEEARNFAMELQKELGEIADEVVLRLKLKKGARHWALYLLGAFIPEWDVEKDIPTVRVERPQKLILDPDATVDEELGYTGEYFGRYRKMSIDDIQDKLEKVGFAKGAKKYLEDKAKDSSGKKAEATELGFIEWWTKEYVCWKSEQQILMKMKNPHWNYDSEEEAPYKEDGTPQLDEKGNPMMVEKKGFNHFESRRLPIIPLSVFNLGKTPVDETSLMGQNLSAQDKINKRNRQIDKNIDSMNGGMVVSLERAGLTKEQAAGVTEALRKGGTVAIPSGSVNEAVQRMSAPGLPADPYNDLADTRNRVRDIFGTRGSSAAGLSTERTVRGKLQNRALDTDRIGGGFSEYLEQCADAIYNWMVQMLYVYDDRFIGKEFPKVRISVKEGSLLPKDSLTLANQAIELSSAGKMSLVDLYKALDYPNPEELAANAWLEINAPEVVFQNDPRVQQVIQARQQSSAPADVPNVSMNYKDLPPEGQAQAAAQAGIQLHPEAIAMHENAKKQKEAMAKASEKMMEKKIEAAFTQPQM